MDSNPPPESVTRLAWYQVISIQESVVPPAIFRQAQAYCWREKPPEPSLTALIERVQSFKTDKELRDWVQSKATPPEVHALWEAIANLSRRFFLVDDDEDVDPQIVRRVRDGSSAREIFKFALEIWKTPW